jgi:hypothetical protein
LAVLYSIESGLERNWWVNRAVEVWGTPFGCARDGLWDKLKAIGD